MSYPEDLKQQWFYKREEGGGGGGGFSGPPSLQIVVLSLSLFSIILSLLPFLISPILSTIPSCSSDQLRLALVKADNPLTSWISTAAPFSSKRPGEVATILGFAIGIVLMGLLVHSM